jgi:phosphatidylglycerophosphatase A
MSKHPYPLWHPVYWLATWFHSGLSPKAPGTMGTLAAIPFIWLTLHYGGMLFGELQFGASQYAIGGGPGLSLSLLYATLLTTFVGWPVAQLYVKKTGREDPKEVVIDEVAGAFLTITLVLYSLPFLTHVILPNAIILFLAILLFRFFDIVKPWPISWMDRNIKGGLGIMLDDLVAAIFAAASLIVPMLMADQWLTF